MKPGYIKELDGLRAFAILGVIIWHYLLGQTTQDMLPNYMWMGLSWSWSGVDLFFVLSGFLIGRILIYYKESENYFKTFYIRRSLRIFPPYYFLLILYVVLVGIGISEQYPVLLYNSIPQYSYFLYLQNFYVAAKGFGAGWLSVTWSLAVEEQFYLLFPLIIYFTKKQHLPKIFIAGILLAPILRGIIGGHGAYVLLPTRMDALLMGALLAYYFQSGHIQKYLAPHARALALFTALVFGILMVTVFEGSAKNTGGILNHSLYAVFYGLVIINLLLNQNKTSTGLFRNPVLVFIGKISYSVYLWHQIFILLFSKLIAGKDIPWLDTTDSVYATLLSLAATIAFSALSYYIFERPLQKIGKKFSY